MGKGDRRGKPPKGVPGLKPIGSRKPLRQGGRFARAAEDARRTALEARCHHLGTVPDVDGRRAAAAPHLGDPLGRVIDRLAPSDVSRLWGVWQSFCRAARTYRMVVLGVTGTPANSALPMIPEPVEADPSARVDARTPEERQADARDAWARWKGWLDELMGEDRILLLQAESGVRELWTGRAPTSAGTLTFRALRRLADLSERTAK